MFLRKQLTNYDVFAVCLGSAILEVGERRPNSVPVRAGEIAIPPLCLKALLAGGRMTTCTASSLVLGHL